MCLQELWNVRRFGGAANGADPTTCTSSSKRGRKGSLHLKRLRRSNNKKTSSLGTLSDTFDETTWNHEPTETHHHHHHHDTTTTTHATHATTNTNTTNTDVHLCKLRKKEIGSVDASRSYAYLSNHVRVNQERQQRDIPLLTRCSILDEMARGKAVEMAHANQILTPYRSDTLVEHVQKTLSLQLLHQLTMHGIDNPARQCILDSRFVKFGMGTCRGADGLIYVSQLFQGTPPPKKTTPSLPSATTNSPSDDFSRVFVVPTDVVTKNPATRKVPTIDIRVDPVLLMSKHSKSRRQLLLQRRAQSETSLGSSNNKKRRYPYTTLSTTITTQAQPQQPTS
ncbi:expressed unknown protein [Seminavis robusta]|uniref:Uncharacterized protein n=1 Tax=Seminavis robusta TaxID=568900 RepID=A0A9N8EKX4_9STRA|nr:expressed unknown protein [Seminavis robusta]|eukprot:Sro1150_g246680.1 n/a (338) ;mRNA; f:24986-25999